MRSYERSGVTIDQCSDCRGIFLDRGEVERLIDADSRFHADPAPVAPAPSPPRAYESSHHDDSPDKRRDDRYYGSKRKKKRSIFEDLFD